MTTTADRRAVLMTLARRLASHSKGEQEVFVDRGPHDLFEGRPVTLTDAECSEVERRGRLMLRCRHNFQASRRTGSSPRPLECEHCGAVADESDGVPFAWGVGHRAAILPEPRSRNLWRITWKIDQEHFGGPAFEPPVVWNEPHGWAGAVHQNPGDGSLHAAEFEANPVSLDYFA